MAMDISALSQSLAPSSAANLTQLARTNPMHYTANGVAGILNDDSSEAEGSSAGGASFQDALLKAMDGVSSSQNKSDNLLQKVVADPNSVDAQDVTIAMAEANMSLNLAKTILSRIVTAWKDVINTR
jgi:flagellar hook-basal body complex protein FliE